MQRSIAKKFFVFEIIASELAALICLYKEANSVVTESQYVNKDS